jgi:hypothetical protein
VDLQYQPVRRVNTQDIEYQPVRRVNTQDNRVPTSKKSEHPR